MVFKRRAEGTKSKTWASEARPLPNKQVSVSSKGNTGAVEKEVDMETILPRAAAADSRRYRPSFSSARRKMKTGQKPGVP